MLNISKSLPGALLTPENTGRVRILTKTRTKPERQLGVAPDKAEFPECYAPWFLLSKALKTVWMGMAAVWIREMPETGLSATQESFTKRAGLWETWSFWRGRSSQSKQREQRVQTRNVTPIF